MNNKLDYDLTIESTKEEVAHFFQKKYNLTKEIISNILKEDISGEVLNKLELEDYKSLGINIGIKNKIQKYLEQNKNNFIQKPFQKNIGVFSNNEEIKKFFKNYLNFEKEISIDINQSFNLSNDHMKKIGLNIGQRIKLLNYIEKPNKINIFIDEKSSKEEVAFFLKNELNFSDNSINELELDGENIFTSMEVKEIEESQDFEILTKEERANLISLIKEIKQGNRKIKKENESNIKNKNLKELLIKNSTDENINKIEEDIIIKDLNNLKQFNKLNIKKKPNVMNNLLLKKKDNIIENLNEFELINKNEEINKKIEDNLLINNAKNKKKIRNEQKKENKNENEMIIDNKLFENQNSKIFEDKINEKEKISDKFKRKFDDNKQEKGIDKKQNNNKELDEAKNIKLKEIKEKDIYIEKESKEILYSKLNLYKIKPLKNNSDSNIFFFLGINEIYFNQSFLAIYNNTKFSFKKIFSYFTNSINKYANYN